MSNVKRMVIPIAIGVTGIVIGGVLYYFLTRSKKAPKKTLENSAVKVPLRLVDKEILTHNTRRFKFALPTPEHVLGLPIGSFVYLSARIDGSTVVRPYTPVSDDDQKGYMDLVIKIYNKDTSASFPNGGKMTQYLDSLPLGSSVEVRGPAGHILYKGKGLFSIKNKANEEAKELQVKRVGLIAGGSGITPMFQLIQSILKDQDDDTEIYLLFSNKTDEDVLLQDLLDNLRENYANQFYLWYTVSEASATWQYSKGRVNAEMMKEHLPPPDNETLIFTCGPQPMLQLTVNPALDQLGYQPEMRFAF